MVDMIKDSKFWLSMSVTAFLFSVAGWFSEHYITGTPTPYDRVDVIKSEVIDGQYILVANFRKTECTFVRLVAIGEGLDGTHSLPWTDYDDYEPNTDRTVGRQTLRIAVDLGDYNLDSIQIRTRHDCYGEKVDKVFTESPL